MRITSSSGLRALTLLSLAAIAAAGSLFAGSLSVLAPGSPRPMVEDVRTLRTEQARVDVVPPGGFAPAPVPGPDFEPDALALALEEAAEGQLSESSLRAFASIAGWPAELHDELVVVAWCESRHRPAARNGVMRGLMQVHQAWFSYAGAPLEEWADPVVNLQVAYDVYRYDIRRGYTPWKQWQCKPDGTVAAASGGEVVGLEEPQAEATPAETVTETPVAEATPTPSPAPWDGSPNWPPADDDAPPPADTPTAEASPAPGKTPTAAPTPGPARMQDGDDAPAPAPSPSPSATAGEESPPEEEAPAATPTPR